MAKTLTVKTSLGDHTHSFVGVGDEKIEFRIPRELLGQVVIVCEGSGFPGVNGPDLEFKLQEIVNKENEEARVDSLNWDNGLKSELSWNGSTKTGRLVVG
jgi:hypothetical protein